MKIPEYLEPFLSSLSSEFQHVLKDNLVGMYIHGSLSYGGYVKERSDIDVLVIINEKLNDTTNQSLNSAFEKLSGEYSNEVENTELDTLLLDEIVTQSSALWSEYTFMNNRPKGSEQLDGFWIELSNVRENGIVLVGPEPKEIVPVIDQNVLIEANRQKFADLQKNAEKWEKLDLWNQTFILVQASRVLYSLNNDLKLIAKQDALAWAVANAPEQFTEMLQVAQTKLDNFEGSREQVISDNWQDYFKYVGRQFENQID